MTVASPAVRWSTDTRYRYALAAKKNAWTYTSGERLKNGLRRTIRTTSTMSTAPMNRIAVTCSGLSPVLYRNFPMTPMPAYRIAWMTAIR